MNIRTCVSSVMRSSNRTVSVQFPIAKRTSCIVTLVYVWYGSQKVPIFRNTLPCNGNFVFRVRFCSVLPFPVFYCCVSILEVRRKEWLKNGKKNGAKNGVKTVPKKRLEK